MTIKVKHHHHHHHHHHLLCIDNGSSILRESRSSMSNRNNIGQNTSYLSYPYNNDNINDVVNTTNMNSSSSGGSSSSSSSIINVSGDVCGDVEFRGNPRTKVR